MKKIVNVILWVVVIIVGSYTVCSWYRTLFGSQFEKKEVRKQIISLYNALNPGISIIDAEKIVNGTVSNPLTISRFDSTNWAVQYPRASIFNHYDDWSIWLEFKSNKLSAVRIRGVSGKYGMKPTNSPPDKSIQGEGVSPANK